MNTTVVRIVECTDNDFHYGFLVVKSKGFLSAKDIQDKIDDIKGHFVDPDSLEDDDEIGEDDILYDEYTIQDIIARLPTEWDVEFYEDNVVEM